MKDSHIARATIASMLLVLSIAACKRDYTPIVNEYAKPDTIEWIIHIPAFSKENARTAGRVLFEFDSVGYVDSVGVYENEKLYEIQGFIFE